MKHNNFFLSKKVCIKTWMCQLYNSLPNNSRVFHKPRRRYHGDFVYKSAECSRAQKSVRAEKQTYSLDCRGGLVEVANFVWDLFVRCHVYYGRPYLCKDTTLYFTAAIFFFFSPATPEITERKNSTTICHVLKSDLQIHIQNLGFLSKT